MKQFATHPNMRPDWTIDQKWEDYTPENHEVWKLLYERQHRILENRACDQFMHGLDTLNIRPDMLPDFRRLSDMLYKLTRWTIVCVPGLIPGEAFHAHLAKRQFPITYWIRPKEKIDYLKEPDLFHDLYGHVPMLTDPVYADYIQEFGKGGVKATKLGAETQLTRLYWYTIEFGLMNTEKGIRIYGAGIMSSLTESIYALESDIPNRIGFDLERMLRTRYKSSDLQQTYFVIDDFQQLMDATKPDFTPLYAKAKAQEELRPSHILPTDKVYSLGRANKN
jgi:phenylalanine-4-hydroxylase